MSVFIKIILAAIVLIPLAIFLGFSFVVTKKTEVKDYKLLDKTVTVQRKIFLKKSPDSENYEIDRDATAGDIKIEPGSQFRVKTVFHQNLISNQMWTIELEPLRFLLPKKSVVIYQQTMPLDIPPQNSSPQGTDLRTDALFIFQ